MADDINILKKIPKTRVELHSHIDGSLRAETVWELSIKKNLPLPGDRSFRDLISALVVRDPKDLAHFLAPFRYIIPPLVDDLEAIERMGYEFIEDKARSNVAYVEGRFAPHGLLSPQNVDMPHLEAVVAALSKGLARGETDFGVKSRLLLCTLIGLNTSEEILQLAERTKQYGVVGIDTASASLGTDAEDEVPEGGMEQKVFQKAKLAGLHRTVHAGERGPAEMVRRAVELYEAERIGHGYHVIEDETIYNTCLTKNTHFECCPWSSFLTGAVPMGTKRHPLVRFAEDRANYSISTDDPTITGYELGDDYKLFQSWGLTEAQAVRASINAAKSAFLPQTERDELVKLIKSYYD